MRPNNTTPFKSNCSPTSPQGIWVSLQWSYRSARCASEPTTTPLQSLAFYLAATLSASLALFRSRSDTRTRFGAPRVSNWFCTHPIKDLLLFQRTSTFSDSPSNALLPLPINPKNKINGPRSTAAMMISPHLALGSGPTSSTPLGRIGSSLTTPFRLNSNPVVPCDSVR